MNKGKIKEFVKSEKGKFVLFFSFYLIFFVVISILARTMPRHNLIEESAKKISKYHYNIDNLKNENFQFYYEFNIDGSIFKYYGIKKNDTSYFTYNDNVDYYKNKSDFFVKNSGVWTLSESPLKLDGFVNINNIIYFIDNASYISTTSYNDGSCIYNYKISSGVISKLINKKDIDISEVPNDLNIYTNKDNNISKIILSLDSYGVNSGICKGKFQIILYYDKYGEIKEIINPLL